MAILIVRHGEAGMAPRDSERELSERGRADIRLAGNFLAANSYTADSCLVSPYIRTQQTSKILGSQIELGECSTTEALVPEANLDSSLVAIDASYQGALALISHQPLVSKLVAWCLTGNSRDCQVLPLPPGGMAYIEMEIFAAGCGRLSWLRIPPDYTENLR